jgi:hypothetical protein
MRMALAPLALVGLAISGCRREKPERIQPPPASVPSEAAPPRTSHVTRRFSFDISAVRLSIEDVGMSTDFGAVLSRTSARLVVNGGFFGQDHAPMGLAISNGKMLSGFSPQMSGGVLFLRDGVAYLAATEEYEAGAVAFAIQCRPRLVVSSRANVRSDDGKRAARTAICLKKAGQAIDFVIAEGSPGDAGPTLFELASELAELGCEEALNLNGGPSTGWAALGDGGPWGLPPRAAVRHVVVVRDK